MELRDLLKGGSLAILATIVAFYICGWQYYLAFFHSLGIDIYFFIPPESAIGAGMQPMTTLLAIPAVGCILGIFWASYSKRYFWLEQRPLLAPLCAAVLVLPSPWIIEQTVHPWLPGTFSFQLRGQLLVLGAIIASMTAFAGSRDWLRSDSRRYYFYAAIGLPFLVAACLYAGFRGTATAKSVGVNPDKAFARVRFSDQKLQDQCGDSSFLPVLTINDELLLLQVAGGTTPGPTALCGSTAPDSKRLLIVKRSLIQVLSIARGNRTP